MAREIFRASGRYEMCEVVVDQEQEKPFHERTMVVRSPSGEQFTCKPMYGTWGEVRDWDRLMAEQEAGTARQKLAAGLSHSNGVLGGEGK